MSAPPAASAAAARPNRECADIVLVIANLHRGGAQRVLAVLAAEWAARGRRVTVITLADDGPDRLEAPAGVTRVSIGTAARTESTLAAARANLRRLRALRRALRDTGAPVALAFVAHSAVLTVAAAIGLPMRVIACERNDPRRQSLGRIWTVLRRLAYRRADRVTANSRGALSALRAFVPTEKLHFAPNPLPAPPSEQKAELSAPSVLTVCRLDHAKAIDVLLAGFAQFHSDHSTWRLVVVGDGPEREALMRRADALGVAAAVDWLGEQADPFPWYRAARVFVLPSRREGMPNAVLEAMSCDLPCVVSDASAGPLELVTDGVSGLVVAVESADQIAEALRRLAGDEALASRLAATAQTVVAAYRADAALAAWEQAMGLPPRREEALP